MKLLRLMGCCAMVALSLSVWAISVWADETQQTTAGAGDVAKSPPTMCHCSGDVGPSVERIKQVLSEPLKSSGLEFIEEPLESVVNFLQDEYGIPISLDAPALEDAGLTLDEPESIKIHNVTLRSALRLWLKTNRLTYVIRNEVLIITTSEAAEAELKVCVYDVRDLIGGDRDNREIRATRRRDRLVRRDGYLGGQKRRRGGDQDAAARAARHLADRRRA